MCPEPLVPLITILHFLPTKGVYCAFLAWKGGVVGRGVLCSKQRVTYVERGDIKHGILFSLVKKSAKTLGVFWD